MKLYAVFGGVVDNIVYGAPRLITDDEQRARDFADQCEKEYGHSDIVVYELDKEY